MLIALLAILGVDLIVIVVFAASVLGRRRWLKRQDGEFVGAARVSSGEVHGFKPKWKRGSGRWVRNVLVWSKGPFLFRDELVPVDGLSNERRANAGEVKRLGDEPIVTVFTSGDAAIEVAVSADHPRLRNWTLRASRIERHSTVMTNSNDEIDLACQRTDEREGPLLSDGSGRGLRCVGGVKRRA